MAGTPIDDPEPLASDADADAGGPARAPLPQWWWDLSIRDRRRVAGGLGAGLVVLVFLAGWLLGGGGSEPTVAEQAAEFVADMDPDRVAVWDQLAVCESQATWDLDTGNGFYGGLQFSQRSWEGVGGYGSPAAATREEQIMRAESLYDLQGWQAWPRCSAQLGYS